MAAIRVLTREQIRASLTMRETVDLMKVAFAGLSGGGATVPERMSLEIPAEEGRALLMPVYMPSLGTFGLKLVSIFANNPAAGLPYIQALVVLIDGMSGAPLALMDGAYLTALRTGAATGLATDLLSRPDASSVMIFGAGAQAGLQLEGVCAVRDIRKASVYDTHRDRAGHLVEELRPRISCELTVAESPREAARADIICTATTSAEPVLADDDIRDGTHINAIGAYRPGMCEIPAATVARSLVVVDSRSPALSEAGDLLRAIAEGKFRAGDIHAEIGEIVSGVRPGRSSPGEVTLFKSVGNAVQDLVAARRALDNSSRLGLGTLVEL